MRKRIIFTFVLALTTALLFVGNVFAAGWVKDNKGWWYKKDDGTYPKSEWFQDKDGKWYFFNSDGYMLADTLSDDGYWLGRSGAWEGGKVVNINDFTNTTGYDNIIRTYDRYFISGTSAKFGGRKIGAYIDAYTRIPSGATIYNNSNGGNGYKWFNSSYYDSDSTAVSGVYDIDVKDGHVEVVRDIYWWD